MRANQTKAIDYPTDFVVHIAVQAGSRELVRKHLGNLPGVVGIAGSPQRGVFYAVLEADDKNHALWRVRNHLKPVCGILSIS